MTDIRRCDKNEFAALAGIWERSVRATHSFLTENDIINIKNSLVPLYFPGVNLYAVYDNERVAGFIGLSGEKIEMLFVDSDCRGHGYGSLLIDFAKRHGCTLVDVNEQNPSALEFYMARGFNIIGRDETDDAGKPYPILHLSL